MPRKLNPSINIKVAKPGTQAVMSKLDPESAFQQEFCVVCASEFGNFNPVTAKVKDLTL